MRSVGLYYRSRWLVVSAVAVLIAESVLAILGKVPLVKIPWLPWLAALIILAFGVYAGTTSALRLLFSLMGRPIRLTILERDLREAEVQLFGHLAAQRLVLLPVFRVHYSIDVLIRIVCGTQQESLSPKFWIPRHFWRHFLPRGGIDTAKVVIQ